MSDPLYISTVGYMVGDCWLNVPRVIQQCQRGPVRLICGSYALPVWQAARELIAGADYEIAEVVDDPDNGEHPWSPGFGAKAYVPAHQELSKRYPGLLLLDRCTPGIVEHPVFPVRLREIKPAGEHIVLHAYTCHDWKNLDNALYQLRFRRPVVLVGFPNEPPLSGARDLRNAPYVQQVLATATAHAVVGIASSFICVACVFHKRAIAANFSFDNSFWPANPNMTVIRQPAVEELQALIEREDL